LPDKSSFWFVHSAEDVVTDKGKLIEFSEGGCSYTLWRVGGKPKPVKELYCPFVWTRQKFECDHTHLLGVDIHLANIGKKRRSVGKNMTKMIKSYGTFCKVKQYYVNIQVERDEEEDKNSLFDEYIREEIDRFINRIVNASKGMFK